jgi:TetR/AcrR family transcriptional regulator
MAHGDTQNVSKKSPGRPAGSSGRDARDLLISAAVRLFAKQGVAATTFATIAEGAGLTPAMVHYYFTDREQLLDAVVEERLAPLAASVWTPIRPEEDAGEMVRGFVRRLLAGIETMPWIPAIWVREVLIEDGQLRKRMLRRLPREKIRVFCDAIARGQNASALNSDIDPLLLVFSILGLVMMHSVTYRLLGEAFHQKPKNRKALERHLTALMLHGLRPAGEVVERAALKKAKN